MSRFIAIIASVLALALGNSALVVAPATSASATAPSSDLRVGQLTVNGTHNPLGFDDPTPRFGWVMQAKENGQAQTAYRLLVATSPSLLKAGRADVWDSGKVESADSRQVAYDGPKVTSRTRYFWSVQVWDAAGQPAPPSNVAWFETGLLQKSDWTAEWIAHDAKFWLPTTNTEQSYPAELLAGKTLGQTFTADRPFDAAAGRMPTWNTADSDVTVTLRRDGPAGAVLATQRLVDHPDNGWGEVKLDAPAEPGTYYLEISDVEGKVGWWSHSDDKYAHGTAYADGEPVAGDRTVRWTPTTQADDERTSQLRKEFELGDDIKSARLYVTALGVHDVHLNGQLVSKDRFAPGWTDYNKRVQYQTYDVTDLVRGGDNAIGARLSTGWYSGKIAIYGQNLYGQLPGLLAQLEVTHADGTTETVTTDDSWRSTRGEIRESDMQDGEAIDAREATPGWTTSGYDDSTWKQVIPKTGVTAELVAQADPPARVTRELPTQEMTEPEPDTYVFDVGQNMVGTARIQVRNPEPGQKLTIRYGEEINPDGTLYTANLRSAKATDTYIAKGDDVETIDPVFTFHGFRYVEITGYPGRPKTSDVVGQVINTDAPETGSLETSSPMLNQLQSNITWSQRGNFLSVPTDCPQRDERMGWTGDINVFAPTAAFNMDVSTFLGDKWLRDLRDAQRSDGAFTDVAPFVPVVGAGNTGWGDAGITVPYTVWQTYGDTEVIDENYDAMAAWITYLTNNSTGYIRPDSGYGDWLNLDDNAPRDLIGTAYFAHVSGLMSQMAQAVGKTADAQEYADLADAVEQAFVKKYVAADGSLPGDAQAGYVIALSFGLIPDDLVDETADHLVANLERHDWHLATGFLGTPDLLPVLTETGHTDVAYRLLNQRSYPSWGYEIDNGATTIWERWNSIEPDGSFGDVNMNSFNHYSYGAVGNWMYRNVAGIQPDPEHPGYKHFTVAPIPGGGLTHAEGSFESGYGTITSAWRLDDGDLSLDVTVPVNTTATIEIPADDAVLVDGAAAAKAPGVTSVERDGDVVRIEVGSGTYQFSEGNAR
ncbi:glycoside hydrolase family 78 protein [Nocardioides jensenii]|uniref:glycoside hydrolase family 78 protein n=1 Tax=Nocardioides jensenii TaxID=1843 RepID=UPI000831F3BA|nr:glycoside hydrolase family 78 protein [Nocardioides jensenii]